ncbi:helicase DnaB [Paenibacillus beijingensis]|uniref:Helicase DnaB n=1 Tax=Paenibacillus beijingensis TaxID=1126833 RepID=A0A0D5NLH6_9BACL|nr:helicase DnaB [Paenibacillus beijingensis]AJY75778.1 helicase DnaB [Paenibacillus beijingensis]
MKIGNRLQFTEHHRFYLYRDFSLSALDHKMLTLIYQPMIGAFAASLYQLLYFQVAEGFTGYSPLEPQRKLFLGLGLEMNERGRAFLADQASALEAVGLLQTSRLSVPENDDVVYEYELAAPLTPAEFFRNQHLSMLLRDKVGKFAVISLREAFFVREPDELAGAELQKENISVPFYELFRLNTQVVDYELEQALTEVAPSRPAAAPAGPLPSETAGIPYGEILLRFPRHSGNRAYVERLRGDKDALAQLNYVAYKYSLNAADISRLLDEDGVFGSRGELLIDELQLKAGQLYRQDRKRESERERHLARAAAMSHEGGAAEPLEEYAVEAKDYMEVPPRLAGRCDIHQYNMLMRNEPHTKFLQRFFPGAVPEWIERTYERIDLNYRLPAPVINVLIHYVLGMNESKRVTKTFIEAVVSNMLVQQVDTFEKAVMYVREQVQMEKEKQLRKQSPAGGGAAGARGARSGGARGSARGGLSRKPVIPIVQEKTSSSAAITPEELEEMRRLARKLDGNN